MNHEASIHKEEDPHFLDDLSGVFDIRNEVQARAAGGGPSSKEFMKKCVRLDSLKLFSKEISTVMLFETLVASQARLKFYTSQTFS